MELTRNPPAAAALERTEPIKNQLPKVGKRTLTSRLERVLVYDWQQKTVRVVREEDLRLEDYSKVKLPSRRARVTIFVDSETESIPTTRNMTPEGQSNVELTILYLDRSGRYPRLLRFMGLLSTLYVTNV